MATIILRLGKGSPLTNSELDANFTNLNTELGTKASTSSLASVAFTGSYSSLAGTPTLGTAAAKDIPATGNASATQVVYGTDTRLSDARTPTAHNQPWSTIDSKPTTLAGYGITDAYSSSNPAGYISGITSGMVTTALGFTPYNATNPSGYVTAAGARGAISVTGAGSYDSATGVINIVGGVTSFNTRTGAITLSSTDVTTALGFTPYNNSNPSGYITSAALSPYLTTASAASTYAPLTGTGASGTWAIKSRSLNAVRTSNTDFNSLSTAVDTFTAGTNYIPSGGAYNQPDTGDHHYLSWGGIEGSAQWAAQIDIDFYTDRVWFRRQSGANWQAWRQFIHDGNYNSYAPTLTGGGASGTWNINITGSSGPSSSVNTSSSTGVQSNYIAAINTTTPGTGTYGVNFLGSSQSDYAQGITWTWSSAGTAQAGIYVQSSGAYGTKMYFGTTDSFAVGSKTSMSIDHVGTIQVPRSYLQSDYSLRAPIFYDSNNTAYYVDPASTSTLQAISSVGIDQAYSARRDLASGSGDWSARVISRNYTTNVAAFLGNYQGYAGLFGHNAALDAWSPIYINAFGSSNANVYLGNTYSPIIYDSQNTAYYVDPNSTSNVISIYAEDSLVRIQKVHTEGGEIRFLNTAQTAGGWIQGWNSGIRTVDNNWTQTTWAIDDAGNSIATASHRAPIFYDSQNTAYFVDPNDTSFINRLTLNNGIGASADGTGNDPYGFVSVTRSSAANYSYFGMTRAGTLGMGMGIDTSNNVWFGSTSPGYNGTRTSVYFYMDTSGNTWANSSSRAPIFYDSNNTAYYFDPAGTSKQFSTFDIAADGSTGYVASRLYLRSHNNYRGAGVFMFGTGSSWFAGTPYTDFDGQYMIGRLAAANDEAVAQPAYRLFWVDSSGNGFTSASMRAPIFYDSNNTSYYVDPASGSVLNGPLLNYGQISSTIGGAYGRIQGTDQYHFMILRGQVSGTTSQTVTAGDYMEFCEYGGYWNFRQVNTSVNSVIATINTSYSQFAGSARSPIFYDSDNTAYYVDPASTSVTNVMVANTFSTANVPNANANLGGYSASWGGSTYPTLYGSSADRWVMHINPHIVYSQNGTSGYTGSTYGAMIRYSSDVNASVAWDAGVLSAIGTDTWGVVRNGSGWRFYTDNNANLFAQGSMRAPIFYDSNNTGYYVDPNSQSNLLGLTVNSRSLNLGVYYQGFTLDANTMDTNATGFTYSVNAPATGPIARFSTGGGYDLWLNAPYSGGGNNLYFRTRNGDAGSFNYWRAIPSYGVNGYADTLYATVFYDSNNTGYYVDPNSNSSLYTVTANDWYYINGGGGVYWNSYGRGIRAADNEFSYGNIGTYGGGLNGWRGYGIYPNNAILMANGGNVGIYNPSGGVWPMLMDMSGNTTFGGNVTAYSDLRLKDNVREIDNVIERRNTLALAAIKYERDGRTRIGYGAQTLRDNGCAEFVMEADDALKLATGLGTLSVDYGETTAILAVTSKMTDARVSSLEAQVQQLLEIINELRNS